MDCLLPSFEGGSFLYIVLIMKIVVYYNIIPYHLYLRFFKLILSFEEKKGRKNRNILKMKETYSSRL
jgi:hypothetical protein